MVFVVAMADLNDWPPGTVGAVPGSLPIRGRTRRQTPVAAFWYSGREQAYMGAHGLNLDR